MSIQFEMLNYLVDIFLAPLSLYIPFLFLIIIPSLICIRQNSKNHHELDPCRQNRSLEQP